VRRSSRISGRRAQAFLVGIAALCAAASASADPTISGKEAEARQVLAQIQQIDRSLGAAVEAYNLANVRLKKIEGDLRENREELKLARANLTRSQDALAARLTAAYTSPQDTPRSPWCSARPASKTC
jgi:peptidoglycan hydrolase CwlO-like protein